MNEIIFFFTLNLSIPQSPDDIKVPYPWINDLSTPNDWSLNIQFYSSTDFSINDETFFSALSTAAEDVEEDIQSPENDTSKWISSNYV